jgi:hypothetical protein
MELTPYVERLRHDLSAATAAGSPETQDAAERLLLALEPAFRLTLMETLAQAAAEITAEMPAGVVEVFLRGREPEFAVDIPSAPAPVSEPTAELPVDDEPQGDEDEAIARVSLRIPEGVKNRAEDLAARSGQSLNSWIVSALRAATARGSVKVDVDVSSIPMSDLTSGRRRMSGWI